MSRRPEGLAADSFRGVVEDCHRENARRMSAFDPDLMQPRLLPAMADLAVGGLRVRDRASAPASGAGAVTTPCILHPGLASLGAGN